MKNGDARQERAHEAIARVIADTAEDFPEGSLVTCWTVIYESASTDGDRHIGYLRGPDPTATEWAMRGLMDMARSLMDGDVVAYTLRQDPEDE